VPAIERDGQQWEVRLATVPQTWQGELRELMRDRQMTQRKRTALPPVETSEQLRARLRAFALATREDAMKPRKAPFPEHVTVLAGPLRRVHARPSVSGDDQAGEPDTG
jgi:hypothetical protein